jgi:hypothetical protein
MSSPIPAFSLVFEAKIPASVSIASFLAFQLSLLQSATMLVLESSLSRSTIASPPLPLPPPLPFEAATLSSALKRVGSGGDWPSTLAKSLLMVVRSWGLRSSRKVVMSESEKRQISSTTRLIKAKRKGAAQERRPTRPDKEPERDQSLRRVRSDGGVRALEVRLKELDQISKRDPGDSKLEQDRVDPNESIRLGLWRLGFHHRVERC